MSVKILNHESHDMPVVDLPQRTLAVITQWDGTSYEGKVVIRHENSLIEVGGKAGSYWNDIIPHYRDRQDLRVRLLPVGTKFEIMEN